MSTISPVGSQSSNGMRERECVCGVHVCVCVCVCVCVWHIHISVHSVPCQCYNLHRHTHTHILKPFENSEPIGLKVDIARNGKESQIDLQQICAHLLLVSCSVRRSVLSWCRISLL